MKNPIENLLKKGNCLENKIANDTITLLTANDFNIKKNNK